MKDIWSNKNDTLIFSSIFVIALGIYLASGFFIRFQVTLNDFWGVLYYSKHLSLSEPASLFNGFFPIGYRFILHFIPFGYVTYFAFVLNILFAAMLVASICMLFLNLNRSVWVLILVFLTSVFSPLAFQYALTISPDIGTAALSGAGIYLLWREDTNHPTRDDFLAGVLFGISTLFRSHGLISSIVFLLAFAVITGARNLWAHKTILITLILIYLIQVCVNLLSGNGPFATGQNFTAYIAFIGNMNWWHIPPEAYNFSVIAQFIKDPLGFIIIFIPLFLKLVIYGLPSLLCVLVLRESRERKFAWFSLIAILLYSLAVAIGTAATDRGPIPILGLTIISFGLLCVELWSRFNKMPNVSEVIRGLVLVPVVTVAFWIAANWYTSNWEFLSLYRGQSESFRLLETKLVGLGMKSPSEVFTNKFVLYFPGMPPFRPQSNGGWENYSLWGYREEFPELPTDSWDKFDAACSARKIKYLVLSPGTGLVADFLDSIYNGKLQPENLNFVGKVGNMKVFKFSF